MIRRIHVDNYKSMPDLTLDLGRVTVLIGANGSGKSNILEAIALASAAAQNKLDNEFLTSRGIRVTETRFMSSAFSKSTTPGDQIRFSLEGDGGVEIDCRLSVDETASYPKWKGTVQLPTDEVRKYFMAAKEGKSKEFVEFMLAERSGTLREFLIYSPENSSLRTFQSEVQILPLGIRGEGLFAHLKALSTEKNNDRLVKIKESLTLIDWFETFEIPDDLSPGERSIRIRDRFLPEGTLFDQRSANEGFLFLLFYVTLFTSPDTPAFFSIDNVDSSLNPKLCVALLQQLVVLAKEYDKQVILTTHSPAILDGLDLHDEEQRLVVVERDKSGHTRVRRVDPPKPSAGQIPVSLSEAFLRGYIGGLPKNF